MQCNQPFEHGAMVAVGQCTTPITPAWVKGFKPGSKPEYPFLSGRVATKSQGEAYTHLPQKTTRERKNGGSDEIV